MTSPSGRVTILRQGQLLPPGNCAICLKSTHDVGFLNLDIYIEYFGQIYICWDCATDIVHAVDGKTVEEFSHMEALLLELGESSDRLTTELEKERAVNSNLRIAFQHLSSTDYDSSNVGSGSEESEQESQQPDLFTDEPLSSGAGEGSDAVKSDSVSGPDNTTESESSDDRELTTSPIGI